MADALLKPIESAEVDGRARSPRFIEKQLADLHAALVKNAAAIRNAIRDDCHTSGLAVETEFFLTIAAVKQHIAATDVDISMHQEYCLARGEDASSRRVAAGVVYIIPANFTLFYSVVVPLSAAIAAGNCVIVELDRSILQLASLLRHLLPTVFERDTFAIVDSRPSFDNSFFSNRCILVNGQESNGIDDAPSPTKLLSPSSRRVVAVVDRSVVDIEDAAKAVVRARVSFRGNSPYAPDMVLVNEFKVNEFLTAVLANMTQHLVDVSVLPLTKEDNANGSATANRHQRDPKLSGLTSEERAEAGTKVILSGDEGIVVSVKSRSSMLLAHKIKQPILIIHPVSSMDDAIDFANSVSGRSPLLATYLFAAPKHAKYLAQFIDASLAVVNHIPLDLLVGPGAPLAFPASVYSPRYTPDMFTIPRPHFIRGTASGSLSSQPQSSQLLSDILAKTTEGSVSGQGNSAAEAVALMRAQTLLPLPQKKSELRNGKIVGYFDQGLITGVLVLVVPAVVGMGVLTTFAIVSSIRVWRRR